VQVRAPRRVNISDIAAAAGVSVGSVSSVLNNRHLERRISEETAQKIRETVVRMGYIPNISARRLRCDTNAKSNVLIALVTSYEAPIPLLNHFV
jgi:LacI family transcriptional regulator